MSFAERAGPVDQIRMTIGHGNARTRTPVAIRQMRAQGKNKLEQKRGINTYARRGNAEPLRAAVFDKYRVAKRRFQKEQARSEDIQYKLEKQEDHMRSLRQSSEYYMVNTGVLTRAAQKEYMRLKRALQVSRKILEKLRKPMLAARRAYEALPKSLNELMWGSWKV